jgi:GntR family transcriptional repressor for pyruvate dehydrogenase complex
VNDFEPIEKVSVVEHIVGQMKQLVRENRFGPGSRLPNERELARQLGVSRPSLREALSTLSLMGILDSRPGAGTRFSSSNRDILKVPFEFFVMLEQPSLSNLHEARGLMEVFLAGRAAERRTPEDLEEVMSSLAALKKAVTQPAGWASANLRFHQAIARAAQNPVLERMMGSLHDGIRLCIEMGRQAVRDDLSSAYRLHEEIGNAIARRDAEAARLAMIRHMDYSWTNLERGAPKHPRRNISPPKGPVPLTGKPKK